jgi:hypothetical protein
MSPQIVRMLLNFYIVVQCIVYAASILGVVKGLAFFAFLVYVIVVAFFANFIAAFLSLSILIIYFLILVTGPFSIVATIKLKKQKALSKWYKFSIISFPTSTLIIALAYTMAIIWRALQPH